MESEFLINLFIIVALFISCVAALAGYCYFGYTAMMDEIDTQHHVTHHNSKPAVNTKKPLVMWLCCWTLYALGHITSRVLVPIFPSMYPAYNQFMHWSVQVNDKYGFDVWGEAE